MFRNDIITAFVSQKNSDNANALGWQKAAPLRFATFVAGDLRRCAVNDEAE